MVRPCGWRDTLLIGFFALRFVLVVSIGLVEFGNVKVNLEAPPVARRGE